jgi:hypothetical protein
MAMISVDYEYSLPNEYCVDHEFTKGLKRTATYDGPDKLFLIINNETGREEVGPITELEKADGRPLPAGCRYVEIDCIANPLICQLRGPIIDEAEEDHTGATMPPGVIEIEGYAPFEYQTPLLPRNIWDSTSLHCDENDNVTFRVKTPTEAIMGVEGRLPTYDDVRAKRAQLMKNSDSELVEDMPDDMKALWKDYRQRLRDWPNVMEEAGIPAEFAYNMEPIDPAMLKDPITGEFYTI